MTFEDLRRVDDLEEARHVHNTDGLYFLSRGLVAHAALDCMFVNPDKLIDVPAWRIASDVEARALRGSWCVACCS